MKKVKTLHIIKEKDLDKAEEWRTFFQTGGVIIITILVAIPVGIYTEFAYVMGVLVAGLSCFLLACIFGDSKKIQKARKLLEAREKIKRTKLKKDKYSYGTDYLSNDVYLGDDYDNIIGDKHTDKSYSRDYKPSVTEWIGGYLIASKIFDELFKSDKDGNKY